MNSVNSLDKVIRKVDGNTKLNSGVTEKIIVLDKQNLFEWAPSYLSCCLLVVCLFHIVMEITLRMRELGWPQH